MSCSVADLQALDDLLAGLPEMDRASIERAIRHRAIEASASKATWEFHAGYDQGYAAGKAASHRSAVTDPASGGPS